MDAGDNVGAHQMVYQSRDDLVCGFVKEHIHQCPFDVLSVIIRHYFADSSVKTLGPLLSAAYYGYYQVVLELLQTRKIKISNENYNAIVSAGGGNAER